MTSTAFVVVDRDRVHSGPGFLVAVHGRSVPRVAERQNRRNPRYTTLPCLVHGDRCVAVPISV
ncbi:MAG: hypothetical protein ACXW3S_11465 [Rhodoplanes sp.]